MIRQTALSRNATQPTAARPPNRRAKGIKNWHAVEAPVVAELLEVDPSHGLTASEVIARRLRYRPNSSEGLGSQRITGLLILLFLSIVIGFLTTAAILNSAVRDNMEAFSILAVTLVGAIAGFAYLLKSARALDAMQNATRANVRVRREGQDIKIKAEELVPGDIMILNAGDRVPADARLIEAALLRLEESALTAKSTAVEKLISPVASDAALSQRRSMVYLGTTVLSGSAVAAVVATGVQTELGRRATGDSYN